ncbi:hypothetical protein CFOL_v3_23692 [Cephalotus follicularis]|uniref:CCHC-type domain-containing protein n=1 Tax=Cephalotus follicularis TaxID=3775 RepID=A0A1Q3CJI2_CEPFO|nr:hypothetical protein CFOL_v3_23692 [Cephalotus follicularis]
MTIFIQSLDYNLWDLIVDGPDLPTTINENGEKVPKPRTRYNDEDRKKVQMNAKAKHIIICAINSNEFNRVSSCLSAKEMWDRLEVTYEGESSKIEEIICYECNKPGQYKSDCPRLKKKEQFKKRKAMLATWDDSDESSSDEESPEEVAQLALMAIEEEEEENDEVT